MGNNVEKLTGQLWTIHISRQLAIRRIEEANAAEEALLARIQELGVATARRAEMRAVRTNPNFNNNEHDIGNVFVIGDSIQITNNLRNERGITGIVITSGPRFVEIHTKGGQYYKRAYFNLSYHLPRDDTLDNESE